MITVVRGESGIVSSRAEGTFSGEVWRDTLLPFTDGIAVGNIFFTPCGRTHWHTHDGGQLLIVRSGEGYVGDNDGPIRISAGDTVWTPPGVRHWHGATSTRSMLHTAIALGGVEWHEAVSEKEYPNDES